MYCRQCGQPVPEDQKFCIQCGTPVEEIAPGQSRSFATSYIPPAPDGPPPYVNGAGMQPPPIYTGYPGYNNAQYRRDLPKPEKKKHTLRTVLIIAGSVLVVAAGVLVPVLIEKAHADRYEAAVALMDSGEFEQARAAFIELGEYQESSDMAEECQNTLDYNAAQAQMDAGEYEQARDAFNALGRFEDAAGKALECQNTLDYNAAAALMDAGSIEAARAAFLALGGFQDAADRAEECQNRLDYAAAAALMDAQDYEGALAVFSTLGNYSDTSALSLECRHNIDYKAADAAFADGRFYTAYTGFYALGDFGDSAARAASCIQPTPKNGETYRNADFAKKVSITIKVGDQSRSLFLKIYSEDDVLVSTVFVGPNSKTKIKLPAGKFRFKAGYGTDWFGDKEMFGSDASYELLVFEDGELTSFSSSYIYTLSFLMQDGDGNISGVPESMEGF